MKISWDDTYMAMCYVAAARSHDNRTKIGAIVVGQDKTLRSMGYNAFPRGIDYKAEVMETTEKYSWLCHAEENAIANAGRTGVPLIGCSIYVNLMPCHNCARKIVQSGISEVIVHRQGQELYESTSDKGKHHWVESFKVTKAMLSEAGVILRFVDYQAVISTAFFNGQILDLAT